MLVLRSDMTMPIARVVATRYATADPPLRFCYVAPAYRAVRPQRGQAREFLQAGIELVGAPVAGGDGRGAHGAAAALDAVGLRELPHRARRRRAVPGAARRARRCRRARARRPARARHARLRRPGARGRAACGLGDEAPSCCCASRSCAAGRRCSTPPATPAADAVAGLRGVLERLAPDVARARHLRPRAGRATSATTRARSSRSTTPALGAPLGGGGRYDDLLGRFGRSLPAVGFALDVDACTWRWRETRRRLDGPAPRRPARRAVLRDARPARRARHRHAPRCARTTASCSSATSGS